MKHNTDQNQTPPWQLLYPPNKPLLDNLQELVPLQSFVENSDWHNDTPWVQSLRLMQWVTELPNTIRQTVSISEQSLVDALALKLDRGNGRYPLRHLLSFAALIHDIGKAETLQRQPDGTTRCPGHEAVGAKMAETICQRFDFSAAEADLIINLVAHHGEPYSLSKQIRDLPQSEQETAMNQFEKEHTHYFQPLLLLAYGDMITSHLASINQVKFTAVSAFYSVWLQMIFKHE